MPGKRVSSDPREMDKNVHDADPRQAGIQQMKHGGGQFREGEAPPENAYREKPTQSH